MEGDRIRLTQGAAILCEHGPQIAAGAVAVIGQSLGDDGDAMRAIAFIAHFLIILALPGGNGALDGTVNRIARHIRGQRGFHRGAQAWIGRRIGQADFGRDGDFADQLAEGLGFLGTLGRLAVHDVFRVGMAGHCRCSQ